MEIILLQPPYTNSFIHEKYRIAIIIVSTVKFEGSPVGFWLAGWRVVCLPQLMTAPEGWRWKNKVLGFFAARQEDLFNLPRRSWVLSSSLRILFSPTRQKTPAKANEIHFLLINYVDHSAWRFSKPSGIKMRAIIFFS